MFSFTGTIVLTFTRGISSMCEVKIGCGRCGRSFDPGDHEEECPHLPMDSSGPLPKLGLWIPVAVEGEKKTP